MFACLPFLTSSSSSSRKQPIALDWDEKLPQDWTAHSALSGAEKRTRELALQHLIASLEERKLDVYVIPSADEHLSEYVAEADQRRKFITGFTGSAGTAVVYRTGEASLYVDSRYWGQAPLEVSSSWNVKRVRDGPQKDWAADLVDAAKEDVLRIGIDPCTISAGAGGAHSSALGDLLKEPNLTVIAVNDNLVDRVWHDKPSRSDGPIDLHPLEFSGLASKTKFDNLVSSKTFETGPSPAGYFLSTLDETCWLLNLRSTAGDVPDTPVFHAYLWIPLNTPLSGDASTRTLFVNPVKIQSAVRSYLESLEIVVRPYDDVWGFLEALGRASADSKKTVYTGEAVTWAVQRAVGEGQLRPIVSPILEAKAVKNDVELEGMRRAYLRDGRATVRWLAELDRRIRKDHEQIDEWTAGEMLTELRSKELHFRGLAYENISSSGPNAALNHYSPVKGKCRIIDRETPYLNDSGAQYLDGTIDTTRTVHFGKPTPEQKRAFTRVLQGHIAIDTAVFPAGTSGAILGVLARQKLWQDGLDFGHGVGHGIGSYLSVHEGPQGIPHPYPFKPGHVISNEPGYYKEGHFGMRVESVLAVAKVQTKGNFGGDHWLGFTRLTRVPIDRVLIDFSLLSKEEKAWLDAHNGECRRDLLPLLQGKEDKEAREFLRRC